MPLHQPDIGGGQLVAQFLLHAGDQLVGGRLADIFFQGVIVIVPEVSEVEPLERGITGHKPGFLFPAAPAFPYLLLALLNHHWRALVLRIQLRPAPGVGDGLFLLPIEILIAVCHAHIPFRPVLSFLPDSFQHLNSPQQSLVPL